MPEICALEQSYKSYIVYLPAVVIAAGIGIVCLMEMPPSETPFPINDKVIHGIMYGVLAISWMMALLYNKRACISAYAGVIAGCIAYGAVIEVLQDFCTLSRSAEMADVFADATGAVIGVALVWLIALIRSRYRETTT